MTNNTHTPDDFPRLAASGYSTRELEEQAETLNKAPAGSYFANALAFIVESLADGEVESSNEIQALDYEAIMEFGEMYNFTYEAFGDAMRKFQQAYLTEERVMKDL